MCYISESFCIYLRLRLFRINANYSNIQGEALVLLYILNDEQHFLSLGPRQSQNQKGD
jgi:hypothetical protein